MWIPAVAFMHVPVVVPGCASCSVMAFLAGFLHHCCGLSCQLGVGAAVFVAGWGPSAAARVLLCRLDDNVRPAVLRV